MTIPTAMRALQQISLEGPEGLRLVELPVPRPRRGEVLIRVAAAGVNFVDLARARGTFGTSPQPPFVAGFEAAGEVVATGDGVATPAPGAQVIAAGPGAFAEYAVVPAAAAMAVPPGWTAAQALGLVINWPTALAALELGRLRAGETVLIHAAAGATGHAAVTLAKHRGARVIAVASTSKHAAVRAARADHVLDARDPDLAAAVLELTGGLGADLVLESTGGASFAASLAATRRVTGRVVVVGLAGGTAAISNWDLVYKHQVQMIGFNLGVLIQSAPQLFGQIMGELAGLIASGIIAPARATAYALADGARALGDLERRATIGKLALIP
ncbi:MAG: zinc-binding dehydrogenase [Deltaproteobacteria bacterium]|nr:zinc-binding dehydrogenase [Deltaproteobacteria bacterium]